MAKHDHNRTESNETTVTYSVQNGYDAEKIVKFGKALSSPDRVRIMQMLSAHPANVYRLSEELGLPFSSVHRHINVLSDAGLVITDYKPTPKGHEKICSAAVESAAIEFNGLPQADAETVVTEMPVGCFRDCKISAPCGMLSASGKIGKFDDPSVFYSPNAPTAELIWFGNGYVTYFFPNPRSEKPVSRITFSFELCSETMFFDNDWKSDVTVEINDRECATFTSLGDFGGRHGKFTPDFWPTSSTQFGKLWTVSVDGKGVCVDTMPQDSQTKISDLRLNDEPYVKLRIGVKDDARHVGGINLFGKKFGDFDQAVIMEISYS